MARILSLLLALLLGPANAQNVNVSGPVNVIRHPGYVVGNWYLPVYMVPGTTSNLNTYANKMRCTVGALMGTITISQLEIGVTTAAAFSVQLAIYNNDPVAARPGTEIDHTGSISVNSTGAQAAVLSGGNKQLPAGVYWWCSNTNATAGVVNGIQGNIQQQALVGSTNAIDPLTDTAPLNGVTFPLTFGTWGDKTGSAFTPYVDGNSTPTIGFLIASVP